MKKFWGLVILATIGFQVKGQDKSAECLAIANVFQEAGRGYQISGDINDALSLTDRLIGGMTRLNLRDTKLKNFQTRYVAYFNSAKDLLKKGQQNQNNDATLNALMATARANSAMGESLGKELVEYCLE